MVGISYPVFVLTVSRWARALTSQFWPIDKRRCLSQLALRGRLVDGPQQTRQRAPSRSCLQPSRRGVSRACAGLKHKQENSGYQCDVAGDHDREAVAARDFTGGKHLAT